MITKVTAINPSTQTISHGYGHAIPDRRAVVNFLTYCFIGPWLRPTFTRKNITDINELHSAYVPNAICETPEATPKAWVRSGSQSLPMNQAVRDQVRLRKGLLDSDSLPCCPFLYDDLDAEVVKKFRRVFHPESANEFTDERLLYEAVAIVRNNGEVLVTLPGLLFFASNPQRVLSHAYLQLMKFLVSSSQYKSCGTRSFDKDFKGPITKQIRAARTFLRETSFFERFQHRNAEGGFAQQLEVPTIAVDEAIVNAVVHRDYHTKNPIECEHYPDAFVVKNPGGSSEECRFARQL